MADKRFEIHIMASVKTDAYITSAQVNAPIEKAIIEAGLVPELSQVRSNEGHDETVIFIDGERVNMSDVVSAYKLSKAKRAAREARLREAEETNKALLKYIQSIKPEHAPHIMAVRDGALKVLMGVNSAPEEVAFPEDAPADGTVDGQ